MKRRTPSILAAALALATLAAATPAHALKVATWNLWQYPTTLLSTRQPHMRTVMGALDPDVIIVQELATSAGADSFMNVLKAAHPERVWKKSGYFPATESTAYWDSLKVDAVSFSGLSTSGPRDVLVGLFKPRGYVSNQAWFRVYSVHFKAGTGTGTGVGCGDTPCETLRAAEASDLRNLINVVSTAAVGPGFLVGGDTNIYTADELAYIRLTESQADNDGRGRDPLTMPGNWHLNSNYAPYHSQCPCNSNCLPGFSGGGLDDRFDLFLSSYSLQDGQGLDLLPLPGGYITYGNDGFHFNTDIDAGFINLAVPYEVAQALRQASDHIPVAVVLQLPSKVAAASAVGFGSALVGATAEQTLNVANGATAPADPLTYTMVAPAGFTAPGGPFEAAAGAAPNAHTLGMLTATRGVKAGTLVMSTDAPDSLAKNVLLSGTVLSHAVPSLDSATVVQAGLVDLGEHPAGGFADGLVRVHDQAYDALQARLLVSGAAIADGDGRFSLVGPATPLLVAGVGAAWGVHFDDAGATADSLYEATLTFTTADEPLPGATAAPDLVVTLRARRTGNTGVDDRFTLRFEPARPNPFTGRTRFGFELPEAATVSLDIYDLGGRRVARLAGGTFGAGRHEAQWDGLDDSGTRVQAGLYFARFSAPGLSRTTRLVMLP
jgi:hypothetical protein